MKKIFSEFSFLGFALLLYVYILPSNPELWRNQLAAGVVFSSFLIAAAIGKTIQSTTVGIALFYFLCRASQPWAGAGPSEPWQDILSASSFGMLLVVSVSVSSLNRIAGYRILNALALLCFVSSSVLLGRKLLGLPAYFFMNNAAADASMIAVLWPLLAFRPWIIRGKILPALVTIVPILAIATSGSSTGAVALIASAAAWAIAARRDPATWGALIVALVAGAAGALLFSPDGALSDSGRFGVWDLALNDWWANYDVWRGAGSGYYFLLGPKDQIAHGYAPTTLFTFLHNDWLQILFEQGILGLGLFLTISLIAMRKAFDRPWLFSSLFTYGVIMLTQFPLRYFGSALIGAVLLREAFLGEDKCAK